MRRLGLAGLLGLSVVVFGCAGGDEDEPGDAAPVIDASAEVPGIEIGGSDTGAKVDSRDDDAADSGTSADAPATDSVVADSLVADTFIADTFVADTFVADTFVADTFVADTFVADTSVADTGAPYRHTVTIDGVNDFTAASEKLSTTSSSYDAYVTWDATALYVGYTGGDVAGSSATKWLFVYLDVDPGAGTGATQSEQYATQRHTFATGFGAEHYYAWRSDGASPQQKKYATGAWSSVTGTVTANRSGSYVELKIPFSTFGATPAKLGVVTFFVNEASGGEWTYAGLYNTSFTDGYSGAAAPKTIASYLRVDLASSAAPASGLNKAP